MFCQVFYTLLMRTPRAEASKLRQSDPLANAILAAATALSISALETKKEKLILQKFYIGYF